MPDRTCGPCPERIRQETSSTGHFATTRWSHPDSRGRLIGANELQQSQSPSTASGTYTCLSGSRPLYFESSCSYRSSTKLTSCSPSINRRFALLLAKLRACGVKSPSVTSRPNSELATLQIGRAADRGSV